MAALGHHTDGCCREVETRVNVGTVRQKKWPLLRGGPCVYELLQTPKTNFENL